VSISSTKLQTTPTGFEGCLRSFAVFLVSLVVVTTGMGQLRLTGQASTGFVKAGKGFSQYAINSGRATFAWRLDLFADAVIAENIFLLSNLRIMQDQVLHIDLFELKMTDIASSGITVEVGEIDLPFGNLGERRFPKANPFYALPLMNEHLTTLRSSDYELWSADARYTTAGNGMRILDQGLYDIGAKISGGIGIFDCSVAVVNGMVSATSTYSSNYGSSSGLNSKNGFGTIIRLAATPATGFTIGSSVAVGPFLREQLYYGLPGEYEPSNIPQHAFEGDVDFSYGHVAVYGQVVYNEWKFQSVFGDDLTALGYTIEGRFAPLPRVTLAVRAGGLYFNDVAILVPGGNYGYYQYTGPWDRDVFRLESACGFRIDRAALVKVMYQWNATIGAQDDPADNVLAVQTVVSF